MPDHTISYKSTAYSRHLESTHVHSQPERQRSVAAIANKETVREQVRTIDYFQDCQRDSNRQRHLAERLEREAWVREPALASLPQRLTSFLLQVQFRRQTNHACVGALLEGLKAEPPHAQLGESACSPSLFNAPDEQSSACANHPS
jgi:hypothetical protein